MNVDPDTVKKFDDYCLRPDNIQDVAYGSRVVEVDVVMEHRSYAPDG